MPKLFTHLLMLELMLCVMPFSLGQENSHFEPKGFLAGRVTSEKGEPLAGVKVEWEAGSGNSPDTAIWETTGLFQVASRTGLKAHPMLGCNNAILYN